MSMNGDYIAVGVPNRLILNEMRAIVDWYFRKRDWTDVDAAEYREVVARCQDGLNTMRHAQLIAHSIRFHLADLLSSTDIMVQSNLYLRAARPKRDGQEAVGWHRESMYGCQRQALNVWMPIANVTKDNAIRYVPGSAAIPDADLKFDEGDAAGVERGSAGHKIGLLYAPKRIVGGVDFSTARTFDLAEGELAVFPSDLIHGAAQNDTPHTRFSVDFRVIAAEHVGKQKRSFAGEGADYFVPLAC